MSNVGRIITLVVEIQTSEYPKWIFDSHMKGGANDVKVKKIAEGDAVAKLDKADVVLNCVNEECGLSEETETALRDYLED
jgi:hypothetical protein